jgi:hypothetical protein
MSLSARSVSFSLLAATSISAIGGCGRQDVPYVPQPAPSVKATLPAVPNVPTTPVKIGDAYSVWGASYYLRSRVHRAAIAGQTITLEGYINKTNLPDAPECAVHKGGKADPEDCKPPIPTFWVADTREAQEKDAIPVMGWASNYAQIFDAIKEIDEKGNEEAAPQDTFWGVQIPVPLPSPGAKVRVTGRYATTFIGSSTGTEANPIMGILTYQKIEYLEQAPELSTLPGVKRKPKDEDKKK